MAGTVVIRHARPGDGEGLAQLWVDMCDYYADLAPEHFQLPRNEGLSEWFGDARRTFLKTPSPLSARQMGASSGGSGLTSLSPAKTPTINFFASSRRGDSWSKP
jgi:hypothetical protein